MKELYILVLLLLLNVLVNAQSNQEKPVLRSEKNAKGIINEKTASSENDKPKITPYKNQTNKMNQELETDSTVNNNRPKMSSLKSNEPAQPKSNKD